MQEGSELPYQEWFDIQDSWTKLGMYKHCFFLHSEAIELSPPFEDFRLWLKDLRCDISRGFRYKRFHPSNCPLSRREQKEAEELAHRGKSTPVLPFDDDTLDGCVIYSSIIEPTCYLKGELEGLIIRYDTPPPPLPTSDNSSRVQTN